WQIADEHVRLTASTAVLGQIGNVIHELQRERGRSAVFVGRHGEKFATELPIQQQATDAALAQLTALLAHFDAARYGADFESNLKRALSGLRGLPAKR